MFVASNGLCLWWSGQYSHLALQEKITQEEGESERDTRNKRSFTKTAVLLTKVICAKKPISLLHELILYVLLFSCLYSCTINKKKTNNSIESDAGERANNRQGLSLHYNIVDTLNTNSFALP